MKDQIIIFLAKLIFPVWRFFYRPFRHLMKEKCNQKRAEIKRLDYELQQHMIACRRDGKTMRGLELSLQKELRKIDAEIYLQWFG